MIKDDGTVIHFNNPKVQAAPSANTFAVTGQAENKSKLPYVKAYGAIPLAIFGCNRVQQVTCNNVYFCFFVFVSRGITSFRCDHFGATYFVAVCFLH